MTSDSSNPTQPEKSELSCVVWSNPHKVTNPKARMYQALTTNTTPPRPIAMKTSNLHKKNRYRMAHFIQNDATDTKIVEYLSISTVQEPVILPIPLAERFLGWTDFEYKEIDTEAY